MGKKRKGSKSSITYVGTVAPTGLNITRSGNIFTFSWTIGDSDYSDGQEFSWALNGSWQGDYYVSSTATSQSFAISLDSISSITFAVRGKRTTYSVKNKKKTIYYAPDWSVWSYYTYWMGLPNMPTVSYAIDSNNANSGTFSWSVDGVSDTNNMAFLRYEWESIIVSKWNSTSPPTNWYAAERGSGAATSGSWYKKEDSALFNDPDYSWTRWFRVRSVGSAGATNWAYASHVYALPKQAYDVKATALPRSGGAGYSIVTEWVAPESAPYPIENDVVNYAIIKPKTTASVVDGVMVSTLDYPAENPSWTTAGTINDTSYKDAFSFSISEILDDDECIFVKIDTKHDSHTTQGIPTLAAGGMGHLPTPKVNAITANPSTHKIAVQATNNSSLDASFLAIYYRTEESPNNYKTIGILKKSSSQITVQAPDWGNSQISIGVQALLADSPNTTTIRVLWDWTWSDANVAEISWSDHDDAWESTNSPQTYEVTDLFAGAWNISGLSVGTWYVRVRLIKKDGDTELQGLYSDTRSIKLSSAPTIPSLILSNGVVSEDGEVTCYWAYSSTDGTAQMQADICEAIYDETTQKYTYGDIIGKTESAQHLMLSISDLNWHSGEMHYLCVRVISASGEQSQGWSTPVPLRIAEPLVVSLEDISLTEKQIPIAEGVTRTDLSLTELPLTFTINSNGGSNKTTVLIERAVDFHMRRPDESAFDGYAGEIVLSKSFDSDGTYTITKNDLIGYLDDDASYALTAIGKDAYGQSATSTPIEFTVHWEHQAVIPSALCETDMDNYATIMTPLLPDGYEKREGDVCDIYRLSIDSPELIYENAEFGEKYVDPYPTLGEMGGHRFVFKTINGDYTTTDNRIAWYDTRDNEDDYLDVFSVLIDYNGEQISLPYNVQLSSRWAKDFQQTNYLGGSIQGDWNPVVNRTGSVSTIGIVANEFEDDMDGTIEALRRLAIYPGICHIRTPDGSSYSANINVSEDREEKMINKIAKYSLEITAVDSQKLDGVTYELWEQMNREEE